MSIRALLPEYVSIQVLGQALPPAWRPLEYHLAQCPACRSEAEALLQLVSASYQEEAQPVPQAPPPDLSFLRPSRAAPFVHQPLAPHARLQQCIIQFTPAMIPTMRIALAPHAGVARLQYAYRLPPHHPIDPNISVEVLTRDKSAEHGLVRITVELSGGDPFDQAGSVVALTAADLHLCALTDRNGVVRFHDVPLDQMGHWRITVTPCAASTT